MKKEPKKKTKVGSASNVKLSIEGVVPVELKSTSSISLKRAVSGATEITVKIYNSDSEKGRLEASRIFNKLKREYKN